MLLSSLPSAFLLACAALLSVVFLSTGFAFAKTPTVESGDFHLVNEAFRKAKIWNGADGAMTIDLSSGKTLWLFGDTWVTNPRLAGRAGNRRMVNNSVALQDGNNWSFWFGGTTIEPKSLFVTHEKETWFWPGCGIEYDGKLFLMLKKIIKKANPNPLFQFDWTGEDLVTVKNPFDPPKKWIYTDAPLSSYLHQIQYGVACMRDEKYLYSLCYYDKNPGDTKETLIARVELDELPRARRKHWKFWCRAKTSKHGNLAGERGSWLQDFTKAENIIPDCGPEASLFFHKPFGCYVVVYQPPFSSAVMMRVSRKVEGPWSEAITIYKIPEIKLADGQRKALVYAAKAHQSLSKGNQIGFTYCANPGGLSEHAQNRDIYFPRARFASVGQARINALLDAAGSAKSER